MELKIMYSMDGHTLHQVGLVAALFLILVKRAKLTSLYIMKYILVKPVNEWSITTTFSTPLQTNAADGINFRGKTTNSGVTHAIVCLLIEIDL